jgi:DNA recombination protein RmuC
MKTIKFTFNKIIYFLNNNLVKILAIFILASILLFSVTLLTSCGAVSDITQSATSTGNYDFLAQFAELRTQMEKLEKKFENSNESGIKMNEKVEDLKSKTEAINKTSNEVRSQNNDIKQMQDKMKDMQIKLEEMMKNFSNNVSTVPSAVTEIKKISGLFDITKQRGIIGEKQLEMILKSVLPENTYEIQPTLENNLRPDFIVKLGKQKFIIDAKFPMQNYQNIRLSNEENEKSKFITAFKKDVKTMIDGLCKYNDNVLMFFPSDNILADLNEFDPNMQNYAYSKKITLTSPSTI